MPARWTLATRERARGWKGVGTLREAFGGRGAHGEHIEAHLVIVGALLDEVDAARVRLEVVAHSVVIVLGPRDTHKTARRQILHHPERQLHVGLFLQLRIPHPPVPASVRQAGAASRNRASCTLSCGGGVIRVSAALAGEDVRLCSCVATAHVVCASRFRWVSLAVASPSRRCQQQGGVGGALRPEAENEARRAGGWGARTSSSSHEGSSARPRPVHPTLNVTETRCAPHHRTRHTSAAVALVSRGACALDPTRGGGWHRTKQKKKKKKKAGAGQFAPDGGWGVPVATRPSFGGCTLTLKDGDVERSSVPPHVPRRNRTHTAVNSVRLPPDDAPQTISNRASERPAVI